MDPTEIQEVVDRWVDHQLLGEPARVTELRRAYVNHHLERCLRALDLVPNPHERGRLLELGAGIYLMTFLLRQFRNYDIELVQYWNRPNGEYRSILVDRRTGNEIALPFQHFNAEVDPFPYPDASFDVIVTCETIEHLLCNPVHLLVESHRVLKPGGVMVLTTPNALRLSNVIRLLRGENIYDKYVQESASARHPREYTPQELRRLLEEVGFRVNKLDLRDVTPPTYGAGWHALGHLFLGVTGLACRLRGRNGFVPAQERREQIFLVAERAGTARRCWPEFLFEAPDLQRPVIDAICRPVETAQPVVGGIRPDA